jgi:hypothetical protein
VTDLRDPFESEHDQYDRATGYYGQPVGQAAGRVERANLPRATLLRAPRPLPVFRTLAWILIAGYAVGVGFPLGGLSS